MRRITWTDVLFGLGLLCALVLGTAQFIRLLQGHGATIVWYASFAAFLTLNIFLSIPPYLAKRSWVTIQPLISYGCYMVVILSNIGAILWRGKEAIRWTTSDQLTVFICIVGIAMTFLISRYGYNLPTSDPITRGIYALFFKTVPQFLLAWNIFMAGGQELTWIALLMGHCTIFIRIFQIREAMITMQKSPEVEAKRRYLIGSIISEVGNEVSWIAVTATWLLWFIQT